MDIEQKHRAGFVNILGFPNVGKSTLMNALVGERLAIISSKPQTTRQRMLGIVNTDSAQIVFSDTPGKVDDPRYEMHRIMNQSIRTALDDADLILLMATFQDEPDRISEILPHKKIRVPVFLVLNKVDEVPADEAAEVVKQYGTRMIFDRIFMISSLHKTGVTELMKAVHDMMPEHPPYFPKDQLTDKPERFFVSEIIREKILELYHQEIPYSCEVIVEDFKEREGKSGSLIDIRAVVYVNRKSQKAILIGKGGEAIKKLGIESRKSVEEFLQSHVFLDLYVKVRENWRDDERSLRSFGYN